MVIVAIYLCIGCVAACTAAWRFLHTVGGASLRGHRVALLATFLTAWLIWPWWVLDLWNKHNKGR